MSVDTREAPARPARRASRPLAVLCWLMAAPGLVWAVVRVLGVEWGPLVQLLAFTPYVAAWSVLPVVLALALRRWWAVGVAAVAALALLGVVVPRVVPDGGPAPGGPVLRVLTSNVLAGAADPAAVLALVRAERVDVLALQEFTPDAQAALDTLGIADVLPHRVTNPLVGTQGSALYSRFPLSDTGIRWNDGGFSQAYGTVAVPDGPGVLAESVHPAAPYAVSVLDAWRTDLAAQPAATPDGPLRVLAGDFNATLDHAPLRALIDTGYVDAAAARGAGLIGTWGPYDGDPIPPVTIDHVLVDRRIGVRAVAVHPVAGSDHRAVLAELALPAG
ncbi:endonuclease/exonuclease/phosphatase family protein [Polymorphospora rubra]|uniref:endonuclease/exonuclease/phosphatase family protein n=1 Tax=Polymorphospora rubra TaxID=338584 RepID=UPI003F4D3A5E